jgi:hypothetical protein
MRETISIATMFLLLAFAGIETGQAEASKTCEYGTIVMTSAGC